MTYNLFGENVQGITSIKTAMEKAGLDHTVLRDRIIQQRKVRQLIDSSTDLDDFRAKFQNLPPIRGFVANARSDNDVVLGVVGEKYKIVQNSTMERFQPLLDNNEIELMTAGCLGRGQRVFICAKIKNHEVQINKDYKICSFLLFSNSHDGTGAIHIGFIPFVPSCSNSLTRAENHKDSKLIRAYHTNLVDQNVENLFNMLDLAKNSFTASFEMYQQMLDKPINQDDLEKYVIKTMKFSEDRSEWPTRTTNRFQKIIDTIHTSPGAQNLQGTVFAAYNGLNTYLNHEAGRNPASRAHSIWFGENRRTDSFALQNALEFLAS